MSTESVRVGYTLWIGARMVQFKEDVTYYIHYRTRRAPRASRKFYGAMYAGMRNGQLYFITPFGNEIGVEPEMIINAL